MIDPAALGRCFDRHAAALVALARQWCDTPEDAVQEAFIKLAAAKPTPTNPAAWLFTVVRRRAISAGRAERRRTHHEQQKNQTPWFVQDASTAMDATTAAEAMESLPREQREVVIAHLWGGLTFAEIGTMIGSSTTNAHRLYHQAIAALRTSLGEIHVP